MTGGSYPEAESASAYQGLRSAIPPEAISYLKTMLLAKREEERLYAETLAKIAAEHAVHPQQLAQYVQDVCDHDGDLK